MRYPNLASDDDADSSDIMELVTDFDPAITFEDLASFGEWSGLPVVVKGLLRADDAARAVDAGASAIAVSNHGGRVLDGIAATADILPDVVDALAGRAEVYVDGGIRTGADVVKALALGARAVMVGRPVLWVCAWTAAQGRRRCSRCSVPSSRRRWHSAARRPSPTSPATSWCAVRNDVRETGPVTPPVRHLLRAKDLADSRYFEPLSVADLARAAGSSPAHFSREFRRSFGESPHRYLLTRRLERAAARLRNTDRPVTEICFAVGWSSVVVHRDLPARLRPLPERIPRVVPARPSPHPGSRLRRSCVRTP